MPVELNDLSYVYRDGIDGTYIIYHYEKFLRATHNYIIFGPTESSVSPLIYIYVYELTMTRQQSSFYLWMLADVLASKSLTLTTNSSVAFFVSAAVSVWDSFLLR